MPKTQSIEVESFEPGSEVYVADMLRVRKGVVTERLIRDRISSGAPIQVDYSIEPLDGGGPLRFTNKTHSIVFETEAEAQAEFNTRIR